VLNMIRMLSVLFLMSATCMAGDTGDQSVLVNKPDAKPAPVACCNDCVGSACNNCVVCPKVYNVTESCDSSCRRRLFGGYVKKTTLRKVYRPVR
jgi:hypothetical protein